MKRIGLVTLAVVALLSSPFRIAAETVGTLTLDGLSFVSFQDEQTLPLAGGTIRFHFAKPQKDGSVRFTIAPDDVSIPDISLSGGRTLRYGLANATSGVLRRSATGHIVAFIAPIRATLLEGDDEKGGEHVYAVPLTTETASTPSESKSIRVTGARVQPSGRYVQLVGTTTNRPNAIPQPGTAVYTVLSGSFDRLP